jgi:integrase
MTNPKASYAGRGILSTEEIDAMIKAAENLSKSYFILRAQCLVAILKKFGKRSCENGRLRRDDVKQVVGDKGDELEFTFTLAKKHKRGMHQYIQAMKKTNPSSLDKNYSEIEADLKAWQQSNEGHILKVSTSLQSISVNDKYAKYVIAYMNLLSKIAPRSVFLFPSGKELFGGKYMFYNNRHLQRAQLLNIIKSLNEKAWIHLFRETVGGEIAHKLGRSVSAVSEVKDALDLENEATAYHYVRRYAAKKHDVE